MPEQSPDYREAHPDVRTCAWSGKEFTGKAYIFNTTEGPELVSPAALFSGEVPGWHVDNEMADEEAAEAARLEEEAAAAKLEKTRGRQADAAKRRAAARKASRTGTGRRAQDEDQGDEE